MGKPKRISVSCKYCKAVTMDGAPCKRLADCHGKSKQFCWQHADKRKRIRKFKKKKKSQKFPCVKKYTVFRSEKEYKEYSKLKQTREIPKRKRVARSRRLRWAKTEFERSSKNLKNKKKAKTLVRFK